MRVTHKMLADTTLRNLDVTTRRLEKLQGQLTSGRRVSKPSDDPVAVSRALGFRTGLAETAQYRRNIDAATGWLNAADTALSAASQLVQRARELAVQGANGALSHKDRQTMAEEVRQILQQVIQVANTNYGSSYLFAGRKTGSTPFTLVGGIPTYRGDVGLILHEIGPGATLAVNVPGSATFAPVFTALQNVVDGLDGDDGSAVTASLTGLDQGIDGVLIARAQVGGKVNRLEVAAAGLADLEVNQSALLSKEEDLEMTEGIMSYAVQDNVYKAALAAGARAIQPRLLDYLR